MTREPDFKNPEVFLDPFRGLGRAFVRFCRVVAAAGASAGIAAGFAFFADASDPTVILAGTVIGTPVLTAADKFLREQGVY